jgi:hypothetical protein
MKHVVIFVLFGLAAISLPFAYMPGRFEQLESANAAVTYNITLISNKDITENVELSLSTWEVAGNEFIFSPFKEDWVVLPTSNISIGPAETKVLAVAVRAPDIEGERRFEVNFTSSAQNSSFRFSKSVPFYIVISGTEIVQCRIISFDILHEGDSLQANCIIENEGNIHIRPRIEIQFPGDPSWIRIQDDVPVYPYSKRRLGNIIPWPTTGKEGETVNVQVQYYDTQGRIHTLRDQAVVR